MSNSLHGTNSAAPGQIGVVHSTDWFARIISLFEGGSPATHCILALEDGYCIGAEPGGARIRNISSFPDVAWSAFPLTPDQTHDIVAFGRSLEGTPYDYIGDAWIGLSLLLGERHVPKWMERQLAGTDRLQCAQLVDYVYLTCGIHLFRDGRVPGAVYPASFIPMFQKRGWLA
jgi:hypothetical protein